MLAKNEVIDLLTEYATNKRLSRIGEGDEEIRVAKIYAEEKYTRLENALTDEQKKLLNSFVKADLETAARMEFLTYQQGLKDMFNLIILLQNKQGEQA